MSLLNYSMICASCRWGYPFLHETYLYHLNRRDYKHNFSPYWFLIYLTYPVPAGPSSSDVIVNALPFWRLAARSPLTSFVPQMILSLGTGVLFGREKKDIPFTWFVQTAIFVTFNKVCTSQVCIEMLALLDVNI